MLELLASHAKQRRWLTESAACMGVYREVQQHLTAAKRLLKQRASEWPQDSVCVSWRGSTAGLRVVAEKCCLGLPRTVRSVSDGRG